MLMGAAFASGKNPAPGEAEMLKVNCLVVTVKIMFQWYNNVVATNVAGGNILLVLLLKSVEVYDDVILCEV